MGEEIVAFFLHIAVAVVCGMVLAALISDGVVRLLSVFHVQHIPGFLTEPLGPIFWVVALSLGLLVNCYMRHRSAPWIGLFGILCLTIFLVWDYIGVGHSDYYRNLPGGFWGEEFRQNFTSKCSLSECLGLLVTMPSASLVAYSIGAWLALRLSRFHSPSRPLQ